ncbi:MAG: pyruvate:ferredoxin (flavodoxin) oxidoreductase [Eubacteriales bacterium]|nr:pyruvate:ferredoxin (flavodoxin) oxidoreductase [Eubacteriales bacterium]MDD4390683.1 pyruvate:ferredoxin (flavodoxin) oxidoreductase [Eubacteriales bacterium]
MGKIMKIVDGNGAAAYVAYPFTEVAGIYPITPSSPIAEKTDEWAAKGKKNIFGQTVRIVEMQSEAGAAGAVHGALEAGALAASYTSSQGLMLMIPTLHRISGQRHPGVLHVAARTVGTHAFSIFGDHSDVMNCRQTGFAILSTSSVQEIMDIGGIAHLAAIKARIPFLHFFDGFRTSHEIQKVEAIDYDDFAKMVDYEALEAFRNNALNPEDPIMRSTVQNPDIYFQVREANNKDYDALPNIVQDYMDQISKMTGRDYKLFNYYGAQDADHVIIAMGSVSGTIEEVVKHLNAKGEKVGFLQVHLYRPFSVEHMLGAIPATVKKITVIDRLKEMGSIGEPLFEDVCAAYINMKDKPEILAGRYGLSSKDTTPEQIFAIYDNMKLDNPKNHFTVGINDDVTNLSLPLGNKSNVEPEGTISCKFWGLGSDGTVGANKNSIKIIGETTDMYCQAYFEYDTKKSFGITKSHLRFGHNPISSTYLVKNADFVACHNQSYLDKYDIVTEIKPGGTFLLNCEWGPEELEEKISADIRKYIADNDIRLYIINANKCSQEIGLGNRSNMVLQAAFFNLAKVIPVDEAVAHMKDAVKVTYGKKGEKIVQMNMDAIDSGINAVVKVDVPASWKSATGAANVEVNADLPGFIKDLLVPINAQKGDDLPVSAFMDKQDGTAPLGTSRYEKRGIATDVPVWNKDACIQCNQCSFVCPHAVIRPFLLDEKEAANAPKGFEMADAKGKGLEALKYAMGVSTLDCTSCGCCVEVCPKKGDALKFVHISEADMTQDNWNYATTIKEKADKVDIHTVKGSQFKQPLLEFSGACAGCGETAYIKLLTQLYGDKMYIANATGCSQAWGAAMPCMPYCKNEEGKGPAWSNSLFENNAEFSYGMCLAVAQQRESVKIDVEKLIEITKNKDIKAAAQAWVAAYDDLDEAAIASKALIEKLKAASAAGEEKTVIDTILRKKNHLSKKSMWMVGGDGWAYDIGYGGLDHVFAMGENVNVLIVDTEVYSNTGGQSSKATPIGAVAQFQAAGKVTAKKDLGLQLMAYDNVYVAQVSMGADKNQLMKAFKEAEAHNGPSIIIAYAPCINHGIKKGMGNVQGEMKRAVDSGYWNLYRYQPSTKNFMLDSKEPSMPLIDFLRGEVRYSALEITFPENAEKLFAQAEEEAKAKYEEYKNRAQK